jgi:TonB family protein
MCFFILFLTTLLSGVAQTAANAGPGLPKEPREVLAAAAPFYDFTSAELKPWHIMATYQLYDEKGKHPKQGTFEYWRISPQVYRSTWTRPDMTHTEWYSENGKFAYESTGDSLSLFEYNLQSALFSPLPSSTDLDPEKYRLENDDLAENEATGPCFTIVPRIIQDGSMERPEHGPFPTYCFESQKPVLRNIYSFQRVIMQYNEIDQMQGKYLARQVNFVEGKHKLLTAKVDRVDQISSSDPALKPSLSAAQTEIGYNVKSSGIAYCCKVVIKKEEMASFVIKKINPIYPLEAKIARIQGTVVLAATIGTDGKIHDLRVISAPSAMLADSSFKAVSQWEYKPYLLNGVPVAVDTTIAVIYSLGK